MNGRMQAPLITSCQRAEKNRVQDALPQEVVTRKRKVKREEAPVAPPIEVDMADVHAKTPEQRLKWLLKVLQGLQQGRVQAATVFEVISHVKFATGVRDSTGVKMYRLVGAHLSLFSSRQRKLLEGDCKLAEEFREAALKAASETAARRQRASSSEASESPDRGSIARLEINELWEYISALPAESREAACAALDPDTKDRLEEFIVSRLASKSVAVDRVQEYSGGREDSCDGETSRTQPVPRSANGRDLGHAEGRRQIHSHAMHCWAIVMYTIFKPWPQGARPTRTELAANLKPGGSQNT